MARPGRGCGRRARTADARAIAGASESRTVTGTRTAPAARRLAAWETPTCRSWRPAPAGPARTPGSRGPAPTRAGGGLRAGRRARAGGRTCSHARTRARWLTCREVASATSAPSRASTAKRNTPAHTKCTALSSASGTAIRMPSSTSRAGRPRRGPGGPAAALTRSACMGAASMHEHPRHGAASRPGALARARPVTPEFP